MNQKNLTTQQGTQSLHPKGVRKQGWGRVQENSGVFLRTAIEGPTQKLQLCR